MSTLNENERGVLMASFWLIVIHILVSLVFAFSMFPQASGTKQHKQQSKKWIWSEAGWIVSLVVTITVGVLLAVALGYEKQRKDTPCPVQLSYPNYSSSERKDIENFLNDAKKMSKPTDKPTLPPKPGRLSADPTPLNILDYDKNRVYLIFTKYYWDNYDKPTAGVKGDDQPLLDLVKKYNNIPVGYLDDNKIYNLAGTEIWPSFGGKTK